MEQSASRDWGVRLEQDRWRQIKKGPQRLVLCRLMIDLMRTVHGAYAPGSEPFGGRLETFFIGLCVAIGDIDGKPFSVAKIAALYARADALQSYAGSLGCKVGVSSIVGAVTITCTRRRSIRLWVCEAINRCGAF